MTATLNYIGRINTPYPTTEDCPGQPRPEKGPCRIVVDEDYTAALKGLEAGSQIQVLYWFDQADRSILQASPKWAEEGEMHGVFSIRSPARPNPIALSTVEVVSIEGNILTVTAMDCVDGTPLLDIKPYLNQLES